jgi:predicted HTH domain antitoxin
MEDHEFVLRFLAFSITSYTDYQAKLIDVFLNETMVKLNKMNDQELNLIEEIFLQSMRLAYDIFGQYAFRKISKSNLSRKYPINKALFEVWSVSLSKLSSQAMKKLLQRKQELVNRIIDIMDTDDNFMVSISQSTSKVSTVNYRFSAIEKLLQEVLS